MHRDHCPSCRCCCVECVGVVGGGVWTEGIVGAQRCGGAAVKSAVIPPPLRRAVLERDSWCCQRCGRVIGDEFQFFGPYSLQHRAPRGLGGSKLRHTMANLVTLCGTATTQCHGWVESNRAESYAEGWLVPNGATPEEWPVLRFGETYQQPGLEWVPAKPHPRQIEMRTAA